MDMPAGIDFGTIGTVFAVASTVVLLVLANYARKAQRRLLDLESEVAEVRELAARAERCCRDAQRPFGELSAASAASQTQHALAQQAALIGTFEWDLLTNDSRWSPELEALYGLEAGTFNGTKDAWLSMVHEEDREACSASMQSARETGKLDAEWRIVRSDGTVRWTASRGSTFKDGSNGRPRILGASIDITDIRRSDDALRESEKNFRLMAENAHAAFGILQGTRLVYANDFFARMTGYSVEEIMQMEDFTQMVHPDFRALMLERGRRRQMGEPVPDHYEFMMLTKDGKTGWVDFSPARTEYGGKPAVIGTGFDITQRVEMEGELRKAKEEAERASRSKDEFLAVLSHELRTPLTPVLAALALLQRNKTLNTGEQELIDIARHNVALETRLIDDLLDLTRIAKGKIELVMKTVDFSSVLQHAVDICREESEARQLHMRLDVSAGPYWVRGDPDRLHQVVWNVLKNAIKFTSSGGRIGVRCLSENGVLITEITDTGVGFEPERAQEIFEAFEQGSQVDRRQFGGLGLGLAISRRLVEMHEGNITAESPGQGQGATFRIRLPLAAPPALAPREPVELQRDKHERALRILLVEDNLDTAYLMKMALSVGGHEVETAPDVAAAIELAGKQSFDLLISDIGLPDRSGFDLLTDLRAKGQQMKAIALSGFGREEDVERSLRAGFIEHITKPVELEALEDAVRRVA